MDTRSFDRFARHARRAAAAGALAAVLAGLGAGALPAAAETPPSVWSDRDGDGLYDDDELFVYGTNPLDYDTDADGIGDGEGLFYGTDPLGYDDDVVRADGDGDGL